MFTILLLLICRVDVHDASDSKTAVKTDDDDVDDDDDDDDGDGDDDNDNDNEPQHRDTFRGGKHIGELSASFKSSPVRSHVLRSSNTQKVGSSAGTTATAVMAAAMAPATDTSAQSDNSDAGHKSKRKEYNGPR